jgi:Endonuclease NucS C-terminal domain
VYEGLHLLERELQEFLFQHPEVLVPDEAIQEKSREFSVQGKRIDLLFRTEQTRYIVELKAVPLTREHIGQAVEYYGLMRDLLKDCEFKMILVSPSIPEFRKVFLEEVGIRCVEIPVIPAGNAEVMRLRDKASDQRQREAVEQRMEDELRTLTSIQYDELVSSVTKRSLTISHRILRDSLPAIREVFTEYEVLPIRMVRADSPDIICTSFPARLDSPSSFIPGGAWWAYAFGASDQTPNS